ncbi:MAG: primosomal protein [Rhodococcus sp. (in: high G+C Gram-positive bacteria)]
MPGDIVPIELGVTAGDLVTLWAPEWREDGEEWEAFLGREEDLFAFESVAEMVAFIRTDSDNDLVDHPRWRTVVALSAAHLEPDDEHVFDLIGVPELAAGDPDEDAIVELARSLEMARTLGEVCELEPVTKFFSANPLLGVLSRGPDGFVGREGKQLWDRVGSVVAKGWDSVLDAIDDVLLSPDVDADATAVADAEITAAAENIVDTEDLDDDDLDTDESDTDDTEDDTTVVVLPAEDDSDTEDDESFWTTVGIDPVRIITSEDTYYTLRCYLDDTPVFLGRSGAIIAFGSERTLARYLADDHDHDLTSVSTYDDVRTAAIDGSLDVQVTDENVYVLPGLADDLARGPETVDAEQLDLAVELFTDAADYAKDDSVEEALAPSTPLGWLVSYVLEPRKGRMAPSGPFDAEAESWRALEREFETRLRIE